MDERFEIDAKRVEETVVEQARHSFTLVKEMFEKTERKIPKCSISYDGEGGLDIMMKSEGKSLLINLTHQWEDGYISWAGIYTGEDWAERQHDGPQGECWLRGIDDLIEWLESDG